MAVNLESLASEAFYNFGFMALDAGERALLGPLQGLGGLVTGFAKNKALEFADCFLKGSSSSQNQPKGDLTNTAKEAGFFALQSLYYMGTGALTSFGTQFLFRNKAFATLAGRAFKNYAPLLIPQLAHLLTNPIWQLGLQLCTGQPLHLPTWEQLAMSTVSSLGGMALGVHQKGERKGARTDADLVPFQQAVLQGAKTNENTPISRSTVIKNLAAQLSQRHPKNLTNETFWIILANGGNASQLGSLNICRHHAGKKRGGAGVQIQINSNKIRILDYYGEHGFDIAGSIVARVETAEISKHDPRMIEHARSVIMPTGGNYGDLLNHVRNKKSKWPQILKRFGLKDGVYTIGVVADGMHENSNVKGTHLKTGPMKDEIKKLREPNRYDWVEIHVGKDVSTTNWSTNQKRDNLLAEATLHGTPLGCIYDDLIPPSTRPRYHVREKRSLLTGIGRLPQILQAHGFEGEFYLIVTGNSSRIASVRIHILKPDEIGKTVLVSKISRRAGKLNLESLEGNTEGLKYVATHLTRTFPDFKKLVIKEKTETHKRENIPLYELMETNGNALPNNQWRPWLRKEEPYGKFWGSLTRDLEERGLDTSHGLLVSARVLDDKTEHIAFREVSANPPKHTNQTAYFYLDSSGKVIRVGGIRGHVIIGDLFKGHPFDPDLLERIRPALFEEAIMEGRPVSPSILGWAGIRNQEEFIGLITSDKLIKRQKEVTERYPEIGPSRISICWNENGEIIQARVSDWNNSQKKQHFINLEIRDDHIVIHDTSRTCPQKILDALRNKYPQAEHKPPQANATPASNAKVASSQERAKALGLSKPKTVPPTEPVASPPAPVLESKPLAPVGVTGATAHTVEPTPVQSKPALTGSQAAQRDKRGSQSAQPALMAAGKKTSAKKKTSHKKNKKGAANKTAKPKEPTQPKEPKKPFVPPIVIPAPPPIAPPLPPRLTPTGPSVLITGDDNRINYARANTAHVSRFLSNPAGPPFHEGLKRIKMGDVTYAVPLMEGNNAQISEAFETGLANGDFSDGRSHLECWTYQGLWTQVLEHRPTRDCFTTQATSLLASGHQSIALTPGPNGLQRLGVQTIGLNSETGVSLRSNPRATQYLINNGLGFENYDPAQPSQYPHVVIELFEGSPALSLRQPTDTSSRDMADLLVKFDWVINPKRPDPERSTAIIGRPSKDK